jgi:hypothetical protein
MLAAIWSPTKIPLEFDPSWARVIVKVSVEIAVTLTISALNEVGWAFDGQTVALKGGVGNKVPWPDATTKEVPDTAGDGAVAIVE